MRYALYFVEGSIHGIGSGATVEQAEDSAMDDAARAAECGVEDLEGSTTQCTRELYEHVKKHGGVGIKTETRQDGVETLLDVPSEAD